MAIEFCDAIKATANRVQSLTARANRQSEQRHRRDGARRDVAAIGVSVKIYRNELKYTAKPVPAPLPINPTKGARRGCNRQGAALSNERRDNRQPHAIRDTPCHKQNGGDNRKPYEGLATLWSQKSDGVKSDTLWKRGHLMDEVFDWRFSTFTAKRAKSDLAV